MKAKPKRPKAKRTMKMWAIMGKRTGKLWLAYDGVPIQLKTRAEAARNCDVNGVPVRVTLMWEV